MDTLICRDDTGHEFRFECANGFVSRVVSAVFHSDNFGCYSDALRVMEIMNGAADPIATVTNNNQPGWTNIVETAPSVTLDIGTKLYRCS